MKRIIIIPVLLSAMFSLSFIQETLELLIPGVGIENYVTINATTKNEIKIKYGSDYKEVKHFTEFGEERKLFSIEYVYAKQGVSFYFRPDNDTVFALHAMPPYKAKTAKGIVLGTSTMQDVQDAYGKIEWSFTNTQMFLEYNGIAFYLPFNGKFPVSQETQDKALKKKVTMIGITAFEE